jgi:hypothetical protein
MALSHQGLEIAFRLSCLEFDSERGANQQASEFFHTLSYNQRYDKGAGQYRVDALYSGYSSALASTDIDLRGSLVNLANSSQTVTFPIVMGIFVFNLSTTSGQYITVGGSTNPFISWLNATGDGIRVGPGGFLAFWGPIDGFTTTAATADILTIAPASGTPACRYMIAGRSA